VGSRKRRPRSHICILCPLRIRDLVYQRSASSGYSKIPILRYGKTVTDAVYKGMIFQDVVTNGPMEICSTRVIDVLSAGEQAT
jgi:hypothetical protein